MREEEKKEPGQDGFEEKFWEILREPKRGLG